MTEKETRIENFYKKYSAPNIRSVNFSLDALEELKRESITTEQFLDYLCLKEGLLLHGSVSKIVGNKLHAKNGKIFATNKSVIAIMRSLYSNKDVNLHYPYFISDKNPFKLEIHTKPDGKFIKKGLGFIYAVNSDGFKNEPEGSWQFISKAKEIDIVARIETEDSDFDYPVKIILDKVKK